MYKDKTVCVVVPAFNEEQLVGRTIDTIPGFVDRIVVVDDCSRDHTVEQVQARCARQPERVLVLRHAENQGVGGAIASGYKWARDHKMDVTVVMGADAQMDPADLPNLLDPVAAGEVDYAKGNRLFSGDAWQIIPKVRYLGNSAMSLLTKIASGYWHIADSQSGYTAANLKVLETIDWDRMYKRYGQPNDLLVRLNVYNFRVRDVPIRPVYGVGEKSGIRPLRMMPKLSWLLLKLFFHRMVQKYIIRDFHPLIFFYLSGVALSFGGTLFGLYVIWYRLFVGSLHDNSPLFAVFLFISGWQFLLFAMWFDMTYNKELR